jgi:hypothetical protein
MMSPKLIRQMCLALMIVLLSACQSNPKTTPVRPTPVLPLAFVDSGQNLGKGNGVCIDTGDVDGDGDMDVIIGMEDQNSTLWLNDGKAVFTQSKQVFPKSTCVAMGDVNGDSSPDAFFSLGLLNVVWLNDGKGNFAQTDQKLRSTESQSLVLGDLDYDGDLDAFIINWDGNPDQVFFNDGKGNYRDSGQELGNWSGTDVALGDVDKDGDLDALVANNGEEKTNEPILWLNNGQGNFTQSSQKFGFSEASAVALGDLDGDGDLDAYIANSSHKSADPADTVWFNNGKGEFINSGQTLGNAYALSVDLGDFDADGDLDAFVGNWRFSPHVWLNDGKGNLLDSKIILSSASNAGVSISDFDGDGDLDVFVASNNWSGTDGINRLWLNQIYP